MTRFADVLRSLASAGVDFILAGDVAAAAHGSTRATQALGAVYSRDPQNLHRIVEALTPHHPYLRGAPSGLPFRFDFDTLRAGLNFNADLGSRLD